MSEPRTLYITTPIYYVNGQPHIGSALTTVCCDVLTRYHRLRGEKVWFLTGTDEQAPKVFEAAQKADTPPQEFVDGLAHAFQEAWQKLHIRPDDFIRTTEPRHVRVVQEVFRRLRDSGCVYTDIYEGWYSVSDETFFRDTDVKDGIAIETGKPVVRIKEENYFFKLSAFADRLQAHIEANPDFLQPDFRRNEVLSFIAQGLRDMSITRANNGWGIPVPDDPGKVIYVWFDALVNYLAATGWPDDTARFENIWSNVTHCMAKEIFVRFHATLWPAMLMALDLPLPTTVYAHGWWVNAQGSKEGKSTGGLPHPTAFTQEIADRSGASFDIAADALRYLLLREMVFHGDTEYNHASFLNRYNTDLANDLGNLCNRTVNMVTRYFDGRVPAAPRIEEEVAAFAREIVADYATAIDSFRFHAALEAVGRFVGRMNRYIEERTPWGQAKRGETDELAVTLTTCLEAIRVIATLVAPVMPVAAAALWQQIGSPTTAETARWEDAEQWGVLPAGTVLPPPEPLFPRIQDEKPDDTPKADTKPTGNKNDNQTEKRKKSVEETKTEPVEKQEPSAAEAVTAPPVPDYITIDDFMKVQLRVGNILTAERVPNADKLLKLTVEIGEAQPRTILAGIAEMYQPDELIGRQVVVVANLQPRKMRGVESQGMLLAADVEGQAILLQPETQVPPGSRAR